MNFSKNFLGLILIPLFILIVGVSFYRFIFQQDYLVSYEGECDPETNSCFVDCEDEECSSLYYFTKVERRASTIYNLCGPDVTECEAASFCAQGESDCSVSFCDPNIDGADTCDTLNENKL